MARKKSSTFDPVGVFDVDVDSPTFRRIVEKNAGNIALLFDQLTGENGEANTITHTGAGRGARLGFPWVNQWIGRSLTLTSPVGKAAAGGLNVYDVLAVPLYVPPGEERIRVRVLFQSATEWLPELNPTAVLADTSMVTVDESIMAIAGDPGIGDSEWFGTVAPATSGLHLLFVRIASETSAANGVLGTLQSWTVTTGREERVGDAGNFARLIPPPAHATRDPGAASMPYTVRVPAAGEGVSVRSYDEAVFANERPISAYEVQGQNLDLNGLFEYATGWPAGGNSEYVLEDQDSGGAADATNPARARFFAHTQALYGSEPLVSIPFLCAALGAHAPDGLWSVEKAEPPTFGMLDWYAPWPIATSAQNFWRSPVIWPDFPTGGTEWNCAVLLGSNGDADVDQWDLRITTGGGTTTLNPPVSCDGTDNRWIAQGAFVPGNSDAKDIVTLSSLRTGAKSGIDEINFLGVALWWEA